MRARSLTRRAALLSATLVAASLVAVPGAKADTFVGCPTGDVNGDVEVSGECHIPSGVTINGNVRSEGGLLDLDNFVTVKGNIDVTDGTVGVPAFSRVEGNLRQRGEGHVAIDGAWLGSITEAGPGNVNIEGASTVNGNIAESGDGSILMGDFGSGGGPALTVNGNVTESGEGGLINRPELHVIVSGNVADRGQGDLVVIHTVHGNVSEKDDGDCLVGPAAIIGGNLDGDC